MENNIDKKNPNFVPALEKAILILNYLESLDGGGTISSISKALNIPKSTVFRILNTLDHYGYITQQDNSGLFTLGPRILSLSNSVHKNMNIIRIAIPFMTDLKNKTGETTKLSIYKNLETIVIAKVESNSDMHATTKIGSRFPLHAGAASKVLLSYAPETDLHLFLQEPLLQYTPHTITDPARLHQELHLVRQKGFAEDNEERFEGIKAIACPVFDHTDEVIAAVSIPYLATRSNEKKKKDMLMHLFSCARSISEAMGQR